MALLEPVVADPTDEQPAPVQALVQASPEQEGVEELEVVVEASTGEIVLATGAVLATEEALVCETAQPPPRLRQRLMHDESVHVVEGETSEVVKEVGALVVVKLDVGKERADVLGVAVVLDID